MRTSNTAQLLNVSAQPTSHLAEDDSASRKPMRLINVIDEIYGGKEVFFRYVRTVADLMSDPKFLTLDNKVEDALEFLEKNHCHHVPVVDTEGDEIELVGIVSQRDLARRLSPGVRTPAQTDHDLEVLKHSLSMAVSRNPCTVEEGTPILEAINLMVSKKFDCLPVTRGEGPLPTPVGILTSTDIIRCFVRLQLLRKARSSKPKLARVIDLVTGQGAGQPTEFLVDSLFAKVSDIMSAPVIVVKPTDDLRKAMELMQEHSIRHLPVVDEKRVLKGITSDRDILAHLPPRLSDRDFLENARLRPGGGDESNSRTALFHIDPHDKKTAETLALKIANAMSAKPVTVNPLTPVSEVAELFLNKRFGCVPVVDPTQSEVVGIVTQNNFLCAITALARLVFPTLDLDTSQR